jgi:16S rRNA (adenine1518-N6/adenine1519-N6)-dimethyltransferase
VCTFSIFNIAFVKRITAKPSTAAYGRLSIIAGQTCDSKVAFRVPGSAFVPPPKVLSYSFFIYLLCLLIPPSLSLLQRFFLNSIHSLFPYPSF